MCQPCSRRYRIFASNDELLVARYVDHFLARELDTDTSLTVAAATLRLGQRKQLTMWERIHLGTMLWAYGDALDQVGKMVPAVDSLYLKLMGHDRRPTCRRNLYLTRRT